MRKLLSKSANVNKQESIPAIPKSINILLTVDGGKKKEYISSCGFSTLANWTKLLNISLSEKEIRKHFLGQFKGNIPFRYIMKYRWNLIGIGPRSIKKRFKKVLIDHGKNYEVIQKSYFKLSDIINLLKDGQSMVVLYTRSQSFIFDTLQKKYPRFDKYFGKYKRNFTYPYPHYALLVGLNRENQTVSLLDPNTGNIGDMPFQKWRGQFDMHKKHLGYLFEFARKLRLMKPRTVIFLKEISQTKPL